MDKTSPVDIVTQFTEGLNLLLNDLRLITNRYKLDTRESKNLLDNISYEQTTVG